MPKTAKAAPPPTDPAEQLCHCEHERKWHDACSMCSCPWFLTPGSGALKRWRLDKRARELAERKR